MNSNVGKIPLVHAFFSTETIRLSKIKCCKRHATVPIQNGNGLSDKAFVVYSLRTIVKPSATVRTHGSTRLSFLILSFKCLNAMVFES